MDNSEFEQLFNDSALQNNQISNREVNLCFFFSMQSQVDEVESKKFTEMTYIEFLEALARLADAVSLPPPTEDYKIKYKLLVETKKTLRASSSIRPSVSDSSSEEEEKNFYEMDLVDRIEQPLHKKIENILPNLLLN